MHSCGFLRGLARALALPGPVELDRRGDAIHGSGKR
jgi:hypothetical protein